MPPRHYARRRLNPYRGVEHIIEIEDSQAATQDGLTWLLRAEGGQGLRRPVGLWVEGRGLTEGRGITAAVEQALTTHPPLPFPFADHMELWLLDKADGLPLALLASELPSRFRPESIDAEWRPFALTYSGFRSSTLTRREQEAGTAGSRHRDWLARLVNYAARPYPAAQWFHRQPDGGGVGKAGLRLAAGWPGRQLAATDFPPLALRQAWNNPLEQSVINDYHRHLAPLLLLLPGLPDATRDFLEAAACQQPSQMARIHRLLPRVLQPPRVNAALVAARLAEAAGDVPDILLNR